ncbi:hypothetical protein FHX35_001640 [Auritidibacter ignavus]|nr:hypothetical protein [Auritidibacter ignavus]
MNLLANPGFTVVDVTWGLYQDIVTAYSTRERRRHNAVTQSHLRPIRSSRR